MLLGEKERKLKENLQFFMISLKLQDIEMFLWYIFSRFVNPWFIAVYIFFYTRYYLVRFISVILIKNVSYFFIVRHLPMGAEAGTPHHTLFTSRKSWMSPFDGIFHIQTGNFNLFTFFLKKCIIFSWKFNFTKKKKFVKLVSRKE